jgi:P27 family predicted phage terminase small subunit
MKGRKPDNTLADRDAIRSAQRAPAWMTKDAQAEFRRVMPLLIERRILTESDMGMVEAYAVSMGRIRELERLIQQAGGDIDPKLFRMQDKAMQTARQIAAEYGLTPVSRSRPAVRQDENEGEPSPLDM